MTNKPKQEEKTMMYMLPKLSLTFSSPLNSKSSTKPQSSTWSICENNNLLWWIDVFMLPFKSDKSVKQIM